MFGASCFGELPFASAPLYVQAVAPAGFYYVSAVEMLVTGPRIVEYAAAGPVAIQMG